MKYVLLTALILLLAGCSNSPESTGSVSNNTPNILLILIDTMRADHLQCYGYERDISPTLDSLASEGTMWQNVQGQGAWTLPTMATIFSGLTEREHLAGIRDGQQYALDEELLTLPEIFKQNGYQTAGFYTVPVMGEGYGFDQGMDHCDMEGCAVIFPADVMVDKYLSWSDSLYNDNEPFFTVLHFFDPHFQYDPPAPWNSKFSSPSHPGTHWALGSASRMINAWGNGIITMNDMSRMVDLYDGEIAYLNTQLSRLFSSLRKRGMLDNTLVVVIADHGEEFAEHGGVTHGVQLHSEITGIPLIITGPGVENNTIKTDLVGQVDVFPTILGYAGISLPESLSGISGIDILNNPVPPERSLPASGCYAPVNNYITMRRAFLKVFWDPETDKSFMYDLSNDYFEQDTLPVDSTLLDELTYYWATPPYVAPQPMEGMEDRVEMFRNLGYLR